MREISNFFYKTSGIYSRLCRYAAYLYRYDWIVTPYINQDSKTVSKEKVLTGFDKILRYLDKFRVKKFLGEVALKVIRNGAYYGYVTSIGEKTSIQELPAQYCRSRFELAGKPCVEFNMRYFDVMFPEVGQKIKMLNLFPPEFKKGYALYKEHKLPPAFRGDTPGWFMLDTSKAIRFCLNGEEFPPFIAVIPAIIDLDEAQDLDRRKQRQKLSKIIIQKMPIDKNGDLVFDIDEAQQLHTNATKMLTKVIGADVLTTFAEVEVADLSSDDAATAADGLERVERQVFNEAGTSQMQFNTDGNIALEKSILNDEAALYNLIEQFEDFLNTLIEPYNKQPKKIYYTVQILPTTIYNYQEMSKLYKEQTQLGYSKMLPQIALGQSQSSVLANAYFENDILDLVNTFIPPLMSSTMNADVLGKNVGGDNKGGRPEKSNDEKSEKTIANRESKN